MGRDDDIIVIDQGGVPKREVESREDNADDLTRVADPVINS